MSPTKVINDRITVFVNLQIVSQTLQMLSHFSFDYSLFMHVYYNSMSILQLYAMPIYFSLAVTRNIIICLIHV